MNQSKIPVDLIMKRLAEDVEEAQERVRLAQDILLGSLDTAIATTPYDVVYQEDRVKLKHYRPETTSRVKTPLLIVYALINRETMLDLQPERSVVRNLLREGIDLYMIDWGYPSRKDRFLDIDDHVNGYMDNIVDFICKRHDIPAINLMGVCMGGVFSVIYAAQHPQKVRNLITTVTPSHFDTDKGLLHIWAKEMDVDRIVESYGNMPGDLLNIVFLLLNPARLMIDKYVGFWENVDNKNFVENFIRMEKWIFDSPDVPGATFRQFIVDCYQKNLLIDNRMVVGDSPVNLKKITMPLLNIYGRYDHLVPPSACEHLTSRVGSRDTEDICLDTGHIGIYVSSKCQRLLAPKIAQWLQDREPAAKKPPKKPAKKSTKKSTTKPKRARKAVSPKKKSDSQASAAPIDQ